MSVFSVEQIAALQQLFSNNGEAVKVAPKEQKPDYLIRKDQGTGWLLIRLLNSKLYDGEAVVFAEDGSQLRWEDDSPITFGDLHFAVEDGATKKDGTKCRDYPNVWGLMQSEASAAIGYLQNLPDKPKAYSGKGRKATTAKAEPAKPVDTESVIAATVAKLLGEMLGNSAKPEPTTGHTKVKREAVPALPEFKSGDVIVVNGVAVQISTDGKRLNKTIV